MKTLKKNNKGFSLVELIVVILIMAIIAVALAPQVMKWVNESKISTDINNKANLKSAMDAAVADYLSDGKAISQKITLKVNDGITAGAADLNTYASGLSVCINEVTTNKMPEFKSTEDGYFQVEIDTNGAVTVKVISGVSGADYGD